MIIICFNDTIDDSNNYLCSTTMENFLGKPGDCGSSTTQNITEAKEARNKIIAATRIKTVHLSAIFKGLLLSLLSAILYSLGTVIVKSLKNVHPGQIAACTSLGMFCFSFPEAVKTQENLFGPRELRVLLMLRGIAGASTTFLTYLAFRYLPLGEASVIIFSFPVFVTIAARIFLKESCGIVQFFSAVMTSVGIVFITGVPNALSGKSINNSTEYIYGLVAAFASLISNTSRFIISRKLKSVHHSIILFNVGWISILETMVLTPLVGHFSFVRCGLQQGLFALMGILGYTGTVCFTMALQFEQAGAVSTIRAGSEITFAFLLQTFFFHDSPDVFRIVGAVLIGFSVVLLGLTKWVSSVSSETSVAKRLRFLMG